jgi:hypothetical protein
VALAEYSGFDLFAAAPTELLTSSLIASIRTPIP